MVTATARHSARGHTAAKWTVVAAAVLLEVVIVIVWLGRSDLAFGELRWSWIAVAVGAEAASVLALGALYRPLLRAGGLPMTRRRSAALGAAASAITATVPGGPAVASGYLFREFRRAGGSSVLSGWSVGVAAALSVAGFGVVAGSAATMESADSWGSAMSTAAVGLAVAVGAIGLATLVLRHVKPVLRLLQAVCRHLPGAARREKRCATKDIDSTVAQFTAIHPRWRHWLLAFAIAVLAWGADFACFVLSLHAVGIGGVGLGAAGAAYGAGLATTSLSVLPGGLGTVETGMMIGLTQAGISGSRALSGIVAYRLVAYVLVAGVGWAVWAALRRGRRAADGQRSMHHRRAATSTVQRA